MSEYTVEKFEDDFENAYTLSQKSNVLEMGFSKLELNEDSEESLSKHTNYLKDLREEDAIEQDALCNKSIDDGETKLFTCIKSNDIFIEGNRYYIKIVDIASEYKAKYGLEDGPLKTTGDLESYLNNIRPLIWVYTDNGIGSLKFRKVLDEQNYLEFFKEI